MEMYVDIADLDAVKAVAAYFPIDGFTTNPTILTRAKQPVEELMPRYREFVTENNLKVFFQVTGNTAEEMLQQARKLKAYFGDHLIVKIPAVKEGYKATRLCKAEGIPVLVTVVHTMTQALMAAKAGADYVAPYVNHMDNQGCDGIDAVAQMVEVFAGFGYDCKVLGASFRNADQIRRLALAGCQAVTVLPEFFDLLIDHPCTDRDMASFRRTWAARFGEKQISDFIE